MKRNVVPAKQINHAFKVGLACSLAFGFAAGQMALGATPLGDPLVPLGDASEFSLLVTDGGINSSDSAFQNGDIGLAAAGFTYAQSGGGETNLQQPTDALINTGSTVGDHPSVVTIVQNSSTNAFLAQAVTDATSESNALAALTPTVTLGNVTTGETVTLSSGENVVSVGTINLNQAALTLSAPAGATIIVNVTGSITLNGGSQGNGLRLAGGVTPNDVFFNIIGGGTVSTTGGGNAQDIQGSILDLQGDVELHPGEVDGQIIAKTFSSSSGALVSPMPVPEPSAWVMMLGGLGLLRCLQRVRRVL
jgi:choice-of-anchor A domain-containing protein